jgi:hypothetical protein
MGWIHSNYLIGNSMNKTKFTHDELIKGGSEQNKYAFVRPLQENEVFIKEVNIDDPFYKKFISTHEEYSMAIIRDIVDNMNYFINQVYKKQNRISDAMLVGYPESECVYITILKFKEISLRDNPNNKFCIINDASDNKVTLSKRIRPKDEYYK